MFKFKILKENEDIKQVKELISNKLDQISNFLNNFVITNKRFLGKDVYENEYFVIIIKKVFYNYTK